MTENSFPVYLHGGGARPGTFQAFVQAARPDAARPVVFLYLAGSEDELPETHATFQLDEQTFHAIGVSAASPVDAAVLRAVQPSGIFIAGGPTPLYQEALCADMSWLDYARESRIPLGGTSAGAAVLPRQAIVGGWQVRRADRLTQMLYQGAGEGLDELEVRPGLGVVSFSVDVHASQWGTLSRLLHAVDTGAVAEGWAIDENTFLIVENGQMRVSGWGQVYHVRKGRRLDVAI
ncbi:MAG: hypothetical protein DWB42_03180 [Chloroflexi bacterium]|nr:hypothetical protein [Chloroflexota bacterium]MDL1882897.1 hypothetical protein [Anaerolineae bacterium CFX8]